ncbi:MAG: ribosome recycling factor [Candidatus Dependentiae bacterium]|nr:ribosome recycling factor [Candidatus Dependentiae bacterium]
MLTLKITEGDVKGFEREVALAMQEPIKHFEKDLASIRTGRASTKLIEEVKVESYGQIMNLRDLATLGAPDARLLTIQPWDKMMLSAIEKGILASDVGITPQNDGQMIRLSLPPMSTERREEMVKLLNKKTEESRVGVRGVRKEAQNLVKEAEKDGDISEDFAKRLADALQKVTDNSIKVVDELSAKKAADIRAV